MQARRPDVEPDRTSNMRATFTHVRLRPALGHLRNNSDYRERCVGDTAKYPIAVRLTIIVGIPAVVWIAVLAACSHWPVPGSV